MATEAPKQDQQQASAQAAKGGIPMKKLLIIGVPVFLVQLAVLFFLATKFLGPSSGAAASKEPETKTESKGESKGGGGKEGAEGEASSMYVVKDLIVNPAGTNGTRFLLLTVAFETSTPESEKELEKREIQVRDMLNSVLTSKGLDELANVERREELRGEIQAKVGEILKSGAITNVYFSKFIIQ